MNGWELALCAGLLGFWIWLQGHPSRVQRRHAAHARELEAYDWRSE